jgi:drug/metabolite transporter (DMT)-like permease
MKYLEVFVVVSTIIHALIFATKYGKEVVHFVKELHDKAVPNRGKGHPSLKDLVLGVLYSLSCAVLWSFGYVSLSYVTHQHMDLLSINTYVLGSASSFLFVAYFISRTPRVARSAGKERRVNWRSSVPWITAAANLGDFLLFIYALYFISASQTITLSKINPLFVIALTWMWLGEKVQKSAFAAVFLVIIGTLLITLNGEFGVDSNTETVGSVFAILAGFSFAVFGVGLERLKKPYTPFRVGSSSWPLFF